MIGRLEGRVVRKSPGSVLLDVGGVGYELQIPLGTFYRLAHATSRNVAILEVHTHVREDVFQLYGFETLEEREAFERLIAVSGVGPKVALAVLSGIEPRELEGAVRTGDRGRLERIPGIGKKTAERIVVELRDKVGVAAAWEAGATAGGPPLQSHANDAVHGALLPMAGRAVALQQSPGRPEVRGHRRKRSAAQCLLPQRSLRTVAIHAQHGRFLWAEPEGIGRQKVRFRIRQPQRSPIPQ